MWKAEEGDLNSPKLQSQRESLPQLQKDPQQLQLDMDTLIVEVSGDAPLLEVSCTLVRLQQPPRWHTCLQAQQPMSTAPGMASA